MFVFTSCTNNYIPKARVLASSLKSFHPNWTFCLLLGETPPDDFILSNEPFDRVMTFEQLHISEYKTWLFRHRVVEICTAAKGPALHYFLIKEGHAKVLYLDPDIMVCNTLEPLNSMLDSNDILLTPHQLRPQPTQESVEDNERAALRFGVFNLGFIGVKRQEQGIAFANWWRDRLLLYCYDDIPNGLFTDQRWCDLAPAFFSALHIIRDPGYNAASWNLTDRSITRSENGTFMANNVPLRFYHFTGFDSGAGESMTARYAAEMPAVAELWTLYRKQLLKFDHERLCKLPWSGMYFNDGTLITDSMRLLYRQRKDLRDAFPNPFATPGYLTWYCANQQSPTPMCKIKRKIRSIRELGHRHFAKHGGFPYAIPQITKKILNKIRKHGFRSALYTFWRGAETSVPRLTLPQLEAILSTPNSRNHFFEAFEQESDVILVLEHEWGGGAAIYAEKTIAELRAAGHTIVRLHYALNHQSFELKILGRKANRHYTLGSINTLLREDFPRLSSVLFNQLTSWHHTVGLGLEDPATMSAVQKDLKALTKVVRVHKAHSRYLFHDYFAVCPSLNLLQPNNHFCGLPQSLEKCTNCYYGKNLLEWRTGWNDFLRGMDEIVFFSKNTLQMVRRVYDLPQAVIRPHTIPENFGPPINIPTAGPMRIAIVGNIGLHKGAEIVGKLAKLLRKRVPQALIVLFGSVDLPSIPSNLRVIGPYRREDLPHMLEQERITVAAFTSICPETFSFVVHELIALGVPLATFPLGAPGDYVAEIAASDPKRGCIASHINAEAMLDALLELDHYRC